MKYNFLLWTLLIATGIENVWMRINIFTIEEVYLNVFEYIFHWNTCITEEDIFETD